MLSNLALSESGFLFDARTGNTYSLNPTGTQILRALIDGVGREDLPARMAEIFETEPAVVARDIEQFLLHIKELGLLAEAEEES